MATLTDLDSRRVGAEECAGRRDVVGAVGTAVMPILAPRRLGSAAMASVVSAAAFISRS